MIVVWFVYSSAAHFPSLKNPGEQETKFLISHPKHITQHKGTFLHGILLDSVFQWQLARNESHFWAFELKTKMYLQVRKINFPLM